MTALSQSTRRKLSLLELAHELRTSPRRAVSWAITATPSTRSDARSR